MFPSDLGSMVPLCAQSIALFWVPQVKGVLTLVWVTGSVWGALAKSLHPEILDALVEIRNLSSEL